MIVGGFEVHWPVILEGTSGGSPGVFVQGSKWVKAMLRAKVTESWKLGPQSWLRVYGELTPSKNWRQVACSAFQPGHCWSSARVLESWHSSELLISISWEGVSIGSIFADLHIELQATDTWAGSDHGVSQTIWQEGGELSDRSAWGSIFADNSIQNLKLSLFQTNILCLVISKNFSSWGVKPLSP